MGSRGAATARPAIRRSSSWVMARLAVSSLAMARILTWCSSMTAIPPPKPMAPSPSTARSSTPGWASASSPAHHPDHLRPVYEVDMRLRPSGASGLLVSSLGAFERYQQQEAWTWEHQALVRARVLVGCERLRNDFERVRAAVLGRLAIWTCCARRSARCARRCATASVPRYARGHQRVCLRGGLAVQSQAGRRWYRRYRIYGAIRGFGVVA